MNGARRVVRDRSGQVALIGRDQHGRAEPVIVGSNDNVIDLDEHRPQVVGYVVCACGHSHIACVDKRANLAELECIGCGEMTARLHDDKPPAPAPVIPIRPGC